jgi:hypothetical protein
MKSLLPLLCCITAVAHAATIPIENADFSKNAGWQLSGGIGSFKKTGAETFINVIGTGDDSNYWRSGALSLQPNAVYRLQFRAKSMGASGGTPISGPTFANRDLGGLGDEWRTVTTYFQTPRELNPDNAWLRFGQWHSKGEVAFDDVNLVSTQAVYARSGDIELGDGETVSGNEYSMRAPLGGDWGNTSRALVSHNCNFNSERWVFGAGSEVIYKHQIAGRRQTKVQIEVGVTWYSGGQLAVDASSDGQTWTLLGTQDKLGALSLDIPPNLLPAEALYIRLRAEAKTKVGANSDPGSFQVGRYRFTSTFDGAPLELQGSTQIFAVEKESPELSVRILETGTGIPYKIDQPPLLIQRPRNGIFKFESPKFDPSYKDFLTVEITRPENQPTLLVEARFHAAAVKPGIPEEIGYIVRTSGKIEVGAGKQIIRVPYLWPDIYWEGSDRTPSFGNFRGTLSFTIPTPNNPQVATYLFNATTTWRVPELYASNYGQQLPDSSAQNGLWWCSSGWKIARTRPLPTARGAALQMAAARNEGEAAQFVLRPQKALKNFTVETASLVGPNGATIDKANLEILRVGYVRVTQPTDATGVADWWPDPLPPVAKPLDLAANINHPFWVRVQVPKGAKAGIYSGTISLKADGYTARVPLQLTVWNFALPDRLSCETAFGFDPGNVFKYHNLQSETDKRRVLDLYWKSFRDHHISPYDPAPLDALKVTWKGAGAWQGGERVNEAHSGQKALLVRDDSPTQQFSARYQTPFSLPAQGFKLSFWYRAAAGHPFIVTLGHMDATDNWMPGRNTDLRLEGNGAWQKFEKTITNFPPGAAKATLTLWPAPWKDDGSTTGQVLFDDVSLTDLTANRELLEDGGFESAGNAPRPIFDWTKWDAAIERSQREFGFNTFRMPLQGLGGGTFHDRTEPEIAGFREGTPEYQAALREYLTGVEAHLREKDWLDEAFVYWFDEPDPKDYDFVMNGFNKLKNHAPGLRRMLTEQPEKELIGGPNLWCPISYEWKQSIADERKKAGERFWWYVCTGPKAPYATLFIDKPATELRVWLWQTWQRGIDGILVWESTYWTSGAAYPNGLQNPYLDPMSWVSGYSTPGGNRQPWGNGDGRFFYPPADYDKQSGPILSGPVDSIRWEMLRDGLEDYEYLVMLRRAMEKAPAAKRAELEKLLTVPDNITRDATTFTRDPAPIEARRAQIAQALAGLN